MVLYIWLKWSMMEPCISLRLATIAILLALSRQKVSPLRLI